MYYLLLFGSKQNPSAPYPLRVTSMLFFLKNITPESNIKVMIIQEMVINWRNYWLLNKFSLSAPLEMCREQYGEYANWCYFLKGSWPTFSNQDV